MSFFDSSHTLRVIPLILQLVYEYCYVACDKTFCDFFSVSGESVSALG